YQPCLGREYFSTTEELLNDVGGHRRDWLVPEFKWSQNLSEEAEKYALKLAKSKLPDRTLYEEVQVGKGVVDQLDFPLSDPDKNMYSESICEFVKNICIKFWSVEGAKCYGIPKKQRTVHEQSLAEKFSAMTWKSSLEMGLGWALKDPLNENGRKILVIRFSPPGNIPGEYESNIQNTEFINYYTLDPIDEPEVEIPRENSGWSRDGELGKQIYIIPFVLIIFFI
ncbi:hypothetical protein KR084_006182, partial [Drosophila pseudotakahashii]